MFRRVKILFFAGLFFTLFFNYQIVFAYDHKIAHPGIADLAVKLYNSQNEPKITEEQKNYIIQGSSEEDTPVRWFNHFYDPVYNIGFSDFFMGEKLGIFPTAPIWLQSPYDQTRYSVGDRSWQRALDDYARGDEENAFLGLGHAIHLLSDMAVPAHTRNSAHPGDSYESFVKNNWSSIAANFKYEFKELNSLEQAFRDLAEFSNNNFYSDRTIKNNKYNIIDITKDELVENKNGLFYKYYFSKINNKQYKIFVNKNPLKWNKEEIFDLDDNLVLTDYSQTLLPQAISYSSGLIKFFLKEAEAKKAQMKYDQMSWWQKINSVLFNSDLPITRQSVKGYVMEKTLAPIIAFGENVLDKTKEIKEVAKEVAQKNQEPEKYEKIIPDVKAEEENKVEVEPKIEINNNTTTTEEIVNDKKQATSTTDKEVNELYYSGGGGSSYNPPIIDPTTTPEIDLDLETPAPQLFLELLQTTTTNFITLNFSSSETTSLPVSFEGEYSTSTLWNPLFPWTTSTSYIFETQKSGDYVFRVRVVDSVYNTSTWSIVSTSIPQKECIYNYLTGDQEEDEVILTKEGSPYILDYYYVPIGKKLIIEAGTVIKSSAYESNDTVMAYANIDIAGELEIRGTPEDKVIFTTIYDNNFDNNCLNTFSLATSTEQVMGGILLRFYNTTAVLNNFEMRQFDRLQPHVQLASVVTMYEDYLYPTNECLESENSELEISGAILRGCGGQAAALFKKSNVSIRDSEISSDLNAYDNGVVIDGGNLSLNKVKISGYGEYPLKLTFSGKGEFSDLVLENNRVNGIYDKDLKGDLILKKGDIPLVLNDSIIYALSSFTVEPGAKFYYEGREGISISKNLAIIGTPEERITIYLPDIYERAMPFNGTITFFKYVDFVATGPYLNQGIKAAYGIESPWGLVENEVYRAEVLNLKRRSQGLIIRNGQVTLDNVRFFNSFIPWQMALNLYNSSAVLNNVSFLALKPYGEMFYLSETNNIGINGDGGSLQMDNVKFSDFVYGVYSDASYYYGLISATTTNMSLDNFANVLYISNPERLLGF